MRRHGWWMALAGAAVLAAASAEARLYKWVDEDGNVTYSERKPPDREASEVRVLGAGAPDEATRQRLEERTEESDEARKDREFQESHASAMRERDERIKQNCEVARQNLRILETSARVRDPSEGERFLTPEEVQQRLDKARENVAEYCK